MEGERSSGGGGTGAELLQQQQLPIGPAVSPTTPGERACTEEASWFPRSPGHHWKPVLHTIPRPAGSPRHAYSPGLPGEWHVWGTDLCFTLQSALRNVLGLPPVSCTWWAGRHVARALRAAGRRREGMRMAKAASGSCHWEDEGQQSWPLQQGECC